MHPSRRIFQRYLSSDGKRDSNSDFASEKSMTRLTVQKAIQTGIRKLASANVTEPESSVHHLLSVALQLDWETGYRQVSQPSQQKLCVTKSQAAEFKRLLSRRYKHEPIQYILGQWEFLDHVFKIQSPLLCPRPETEELVMKIVKEQVQGGSANNDSPLRILEIGCGTGVIGISLAAQLPNAQVLAIDIEPVAIQISMENAQQILGDEDGSRYKAILCSAAEYFLGENNDGPAKKFDMIVSNPPYIPTEDYKSLSPDVKDYESEYALHAGEDGLEVIYDIVQGLSRWCRPGAICWMEVDPTHPKLLKAYLLSTKRDNKGVAFLSAHEDMFGKQRFVKIQYQGTQ
jgi:release factor glutamine methyltransferase